MLRREFAGKQSGTKSFVDAARPGRYNSASSHTLTCALAFFVLIYRKGRLGYMTPRWNKDKIADEIRKLQADGIHLNYGAVQNNNLRLLRAATRYFGSWKEAVEHAGLTYDDVRRYRVWSKDAIVAQIKKHQANSADLSWRHVSTTLDPPLAAAAIRAQRFGSWEKALGAAGIDYDDVRRHRSWTQGAVLEELQQLHKAGKSLRVSDVAKTQPALVAAARRRFESWYDAVDEAGVDVNEARKGKPGRNGETPNA